MKKFNFKWCVFVLTLVVVMPFLCVVSTPLQSVNAESSFNISVTQNKVTSITGDFAGMKVDSVDTAFKALNNFSNELGFKDSKKALTFSRKNQTVIGSVYRFNQQVDGYKVYSGELILNVNSEGRIMSINGSYYKDLKIEPINFSKKDALEQIKSNYEVEEIEFLEENVLPECANCIAYVFEAKMLDDIYHVFVDSNTNEIVKLVKATAALSDRMLNELPSLSDYTKEDVKTTYTYSNGKEITLDIDKYVSKTKQEYFYVLGDNERAIYILDGENKTIVEDAKYYATYSESAAFNTELAVKAYEHIMQCYEFYKNQNNFGVSIEGLTNPAGKKIKLLAIVHYDKNYENAAYVLGNDKTGYFYFGDGNASLGTGPFVNGLDVVAHEYQHCITDSIVELEYFNESGAICEAYSDIFGACVEGNELSDIDFWRMGEDIYIANNYFRDMSNPAATGCTYNYEKLYPLCTNPYCAHTKCDNGGVHYNSTLMTYATYVMYKQDIEFFTKEVILKLWYQTLTKLNKTSTFIEFAELMLQSAEELNFSEENLSDIEFAFSSIGLPGYSGIEIWGDNTLQYLQGSGTIASPYLINSVADLATVAYYINDQKSEKYANARYQVNVDLNLNNIPWIGIGTEMMPFNGSFNGGGKTISGLNLQAETGEEYKGLFNIAGDNSYIYDIRIANNESYTNAKYAGSIAGITKGTIAGCSSQLSLTGDRVGGIAGLGVNDFGGEKVVNSYSTGDLTGNIVGGLIAEFSTRYNTSKAQHFSGYVASSYSTGKLTGKIVGGLVGRANGIYILNAITTVEIVPVEGNSIIGGLLGELTAKNVVDNNYEALGFSQNMILSSKVAPKINIQENQVNVSLLIGSVNINPWEATLYIENTIAKKQNNLSLLPSDVKGDNIKIQKSVISEDNVYDGDFDFDNEKYYKDYSKWSVLEGVEGFNFVSTFEIKTPGSMPEFKESDFWLNYSASGFDSGNGTEFDPYIIKTAEQLALLAQLVGSSQYNNYYSDKYYALGADIDLSGKIWAGIGTTYISVVNNVSSQEVYSFKGVFNGNGYSILNMNALSAYSVKALSQSGNNYLLTEYLPALFSVIENGAIIKNLKLEDVNSNGSYAAGVASKAFGSITLEDVSVSNGNITSNFISGGLIASLEGIDGIYLNSFETNIVNCNTQINISGKIVGGAVGYASNASNIVRNTLNVINFLNQGKISVTGNDVDTEVINNSIYYYRPMAGSIVGLNLIENLNVINCINVGVIVSYNNGAYIGAYIGSIGFGDKNTKASVNVLIDGCKQVGEVCYVFDSSISSAGNIVGGTHRELNSSISIIVTDKTYSILNVDLIRNNNTVTGINLESNIKIVESEIGCEDFDFYNQSYFSNSKYFNSNYYWSEKLQNRLLTVITFRDFNGIVLGTIYLKVGETEIGFEKTPVPGKIISQQYEYVFTGWDRNLTELTRSMSIYAEYKAIVRKFNVTYLNDDGESIKSLELEFGSSVNQEVEAPTKKGGLLFTYEFIRWGAEGQTVTGQMQIKPYYKLKITKAGKAVLITATISCLAILYIVYKKKQEKFR